MKTTAPLFLLVLWLLAGPGTLRAQSQMEMNQQAAAAFEKADKEMNKIYAKVIASLDAEGAAKLKAVQRAWLVLRDAQAAFDADAERGGSLAPMIYSGSEADLTKQRTAQLKALLGPK